MRIMSSAQLADRLDDLFAVLVGGARSAPPRHQALRATLDWSHDLLGDDERAVFRRLAVFSGGFTLPAAERVAAGGDIRPDAMLELLTRLADKSLLRVEHARGGTRYHLLATIQDYAGERLAEAGEAALVRQAHLEYVTDLVEHAAAGIERVEEQAGPLELELDRLDTELANIRRASEHAQQGGDPEAALRIAAPLDRYAYLRGRYHQVRQWMDEAVACCPDAPAALRARALLGSGRLALLQCDYAPAVRRLEAALRQYRELDDPRGIAGALQVLGSVAREQGRYARAVELHAESLTVAEAAGDRWAVASAHGYLAFVSWLQRDFPRASTEAETALAAFRDLGDVEGAAWSLISLGTVARYQGEVERAAVLLAESRSLSEGIGFREGIAWAAEQLGLLAAVDGDPAAIDLLRRSLELHGELRDRWRMSSVLEDLATIALALGQPVPAGRLLGAAEAIREAIGTVIAPCERPQHLQTAAAVRAALGEEGFAAARQQGLAASLDELTADLPSAQDAIPPVAPAEAEPAASAPAGSAPAAQARPEQGRPAPVMARAATGPLRIRALGAAAVELGDTALTAADWGYAKPRELMFLLAFFAGDDQGPDRRRAVAGPVAPAARQRAAYGAARAAPRAGRPGLGGLRGRPLPLRPVPAARVRRDHLRGRAGRRAPRPPGRGGPARAAAGRRRLRRRLPGRHVGRRMGAGAPGRTAPGLRVGPAGHRPAADRGRPVPGRGVGLPPGRRPRAAERDRAPGADELLGPAR